MEESPFVERKASELDLFISGRKGGRVGGYDQYDVTERRMESGHYSHGYRYWL